MEPAVTSSNPDLTCLEGMVVHGLDLSYFTGKLQAYLRYCELPHRFVDMDTATMRRAAHETGMAQMPAIELADGRWMTDTTPIIAWIEARRTGPAVMPADPVQKVMSLILEDYADEWLWRPALHYRWSFEPDTRLMGHRIAAEMMRDIPLPVTLRRAMIIRRQQVKYVTGDGIKPATRTHVESVYLRNLAWLEAILQTRPFLLGDRPTLADFGFMGPMFRHFSLDPTPARIMRDQAPAVFAWVGRVWAARQQGFGEAALVEGIPADWDPILAHAGQTYLPYLAANASAFGRGDKRLSVTLEGVTYDLPVVPYRVHCLEALQTAISDLTGGAAAQVRARLEATGCWQPLWQVKAPDTGFDPEGRLPFLTRQTAWTTPVRP